MESLQGRFQLLFKITIIFAFLGLAVFTQDAGAQPPNDECVTAIEVFDGVTPYDNINASDSAPGWTCAGGGSDVWFRYTATCTGEAVFETCNNGALPITDYDSAIEIFDTGSCAEVGVAPVQCNDDDCGLQSSLTQVVNLGDTYLIRVGGFIGSQGTGHLEINCLSPITNVPTLSEWGLIAMAGVLGLVGFMVMRRRKVTA